MSRELDPGLTEGAAPESTRYSILRCLGVRDKAETYLCQDGQTEGRSVVRKILSAQFSAENPDIVDLIFPRWASLDHPNVAKVLDFGWEEGKAFLNTEYFEGVPLLQALSGAALDKVWLLFGQLFLALEYLISQDILHLDLKPQNVLVAPDGAGGFTLKLVDYGWMPLLYPPNPMDTNAIGMAPYTAPEYALRRVSDPRSDLYSVGILLYAALARRLPFAEKDPVALVQAQLQRDPPPLKSVVAGAPQALSDFIQRLLARDPQGRFESPGQALAAFQTAVGAAFPADKLAWAPPFSDIQTVFQLKEFLKLFRRIAIQGGRWAIQGPAGSGKSFLARWLERLFWLNQKRVVFISGDSLSLIQGEDSLNPAIPTFLIIDDAERAPVEAWLRARPYSHVVALGRDMGWAKKANAWEAWKLPVLPQAQVVEALLQNFGKPDPRIAAWFQTRSNGLPQGLVLGTRALERQGMLRREGATCVWDTEKLLRAAASANAALLGATFQSLPAAARPVFGRMALVPVPLRVETIAAAAGLAPEAAVGILDELVKMGLVMRRLKNGEEYFEAEESAEAPPASIVSQEARLAWFEVLAAQGWYGAAAEAVPEAFPNAAQNPKATLLQAKLYAAAGAHAEVLKRVTSDFVNSLPAEQKSLAFEVLGTSLRGTGKDKQAEAAFRNAFQQYKSEQNAAGQARVLTQMGGLSQQGGDLSRALQFYQQALDAAAAAPDRELLQGRIEVQIAQLYVGATDFENAETHFQKALTALEAARQGMALAGVYVDYATLCFQLNDPDRAQVFCQEALGWALFQRHLPLQAKIFSLWARIEVQRENVRGANGRYGEAVDVLAKSQDPLAYARALADRSMFYEVHRDLPAAEKDARQALELARRFQAPDIEGLALLSLGKIQSRSMEMLPAAQKSLWAAQPLLTKAKDPSYVWQCEFQLGEIERFRGNNPAAQKHYQKTLQLIDQRLANLVPQTYEATQLAQHRREVEMSMQVFV